MFYPELSFPQAIARIAQATKRKLETEDIASLALEQLQQFGGFTLDQYGQTPTSGYAVSLPHNESIHKIPRFSKDLFPVLVMEAPRQLLPFPINGRLIPTYWGGWIDGELLYLDQSIVVDDFDLAIHIGKLGNQKAIYSIHDQQTINLQDFGN